MTLAQTPVKPRILVAPLDWGLGHATRCIPVIRYLITRGADVWLAGDGKIATLLKLEFPGLPFLSLPGYAVQYGKTPAGTMLALIRQTPKLLRIIKQEHAWLQAVVAAHNFNAVLSDNRYGLHHPGVYSVFMTHQLLVKTGTRATDVLLQKALYRYINQFDACWVPDAAGTVTLAGALSHPQKQLQIPVTYLGVLSRFSLGDAVLEHYVLVLLSGPEPQRTVLEAKILQQAQLFQTPMLVVRGLPGTTGLPKVPYHVTIVNHLPAATLQKAIAGAQYVISRCGYSTVMELMMLQKKCIFIPTPMQTEQGYLAQHLMQQNAALCIPQQKLQLKNALELAAAFPYRLPELEKTDALEQAVDALLAVLEQKQMGRLQ
jgi:UDP-N-acetylglucosamine transferase subunit ALG13